MDKILKETSKTKSVQNKRTAYYSCNVSKEFQRNLKGQKHLNSIRRKFTASLFQRVAFSVLKLFLARFSPVGDLSTHNFAYLIFQLNTKEFSKMFYLLLHVVLLDETSMRGFRKHYFQDIYMIHVIIKTALVLAIPKFIQK